MDIASTTNGDEGKARSVLTTELQWVGAQCDTTTFAIGSAVADGWLAMNEPEKSRHIMESIAPVTDDEDAKKFFKLVNFHTLLGDKEPAFLALSKLQKDHAGSPETELASVRYLCQFERCALALPMAVSLEKKRPDDLYVRTMVAFAYADRHEFGLAADRFGSVLATGQVWHMDSAVMLVGVTSLSNVHRKEEARRLYELAKANHQFREDRDLRNIEMMRTIVDDKSGQIFMFSQWPIAGDESSTPPRSAATAQDMNPKQVKVLVDAVHEFSRR